MTSSYPQEPANIQQDLNRVSVDGFGRSLQELSEKLSCVQGNSSSTGNANQQRQPTQNPEFDWDDNKYDFSHTKRGLAVIINNEDFSKSRGPKKGHEDRLGSDKDASALYDTFILHGFDVALHNDLEAYRMVDVLDAAANNYDHEASDCFVCAVLTHGNCTEETKEHLDVLYGVDGRPVPVDCLVKKFNDTNCPALKDKPRLFFLQACRGQKCDDGQTVLVEKTEPTTPMDQGGVGDQLVKEKGLAVTLQESSRLSVDEPLQNLALDKTDVLEDDEEESNPNQPVASSLNQQVANNPNQQAASNPSQPAASNPNQPVASCDRLYVLRRSSDGPMSHPAPLYKDFLIMYAAPSGHMAWRNEERGSWFVQTLCEVLNGTDLTSVSLSRALTRVTGLIAMNFESNSDKFVKKKGIPQVQTQLRKDVFISKKTK